MVPTAGLEPAQVAPLAPQTSASTNFATSAGHGHSPKLFMGFAQTFNGVAATPSTNSAALRAGKNISRYFGGVVGLGGGAAGAGLAGVGAAGAVAAACAARSSTLLGSPLGRAPM
jgi:hypothetical protein